MARNIKKRTTGRAQYLTFTLDGVKVQAARYRISNTAYSPWLITQGEDVLPGSAIARGKYLSRLFAA
jgi:hypothetical protein